jgi:alcohol dehydrogenase
MKAVVLREHGGNDKLVLETDFPDPIPGEGDVVLRVRASSLNYHDVFTRRGMPGIKIAMPAIMGLDVAGEIVEVGPGVTGWRVGDRVLVDPLNRVEGGLMGETIHGGLAELCRARAHQLIRIPEGVSYEDAAALPCAYGTAHRMMYTNGFVKSGEKVLILGASGGVGVCCLQLAKLAGAEVIACAGTDAKAARLKALGADHVINYAEQDFVKEIYALYGKPNRRGAGVGLGVDVVVNYTGGDTWVKSLRVLKVGGRILTCGATAGFDPKEDLRFIWTFELKILGSNGWAREDVTTLLQLVQAGKLQGVVDTTFPLEQAPEALRRIEEREVFGKLVITP